MKFILTYDGPLSSGNRATSRIPQIWDIRKHIHPQLEELWRTNPALQRLKKSAVVHPTYHYGKAELYHLAPDELAEGDPLTGGMIRLTEPINRGGRNYVPLVRDSIALICGIDILFLRREEPGKVVSSDGDIDNRLKTLFDGLRLPKGDELPAPPEVPDPLCCLLEDDSLISDLSVKTGRLLGSQQEDRGQVRLIMEVTIKATIVKTYNLILLSN
jgi:hypothetical protein